MVDKACLVTVEHSIEAKWEEFVMKQFLNLLLALVFIFQIIEIVQIG